MLEYIAGFITGVFFVGAVCLVTGYKFAKILQK